jgi:sulfonate transport system substrate-binding protein
MEKNMSRRTLSSIRQGRFPRKVQIAAGLVLAAGAVSSLCPVSPSSAAVDKAKSPNLSNVTLAVGDQEQKTEAMLQAAGELKGIKYHITWSEFTSGPPEIQALGANSIDVATSVGDSPPIFAAAAGPSEASVRVVSALNPGGDGDAILVPKGSKVTKVSQLAGKTVAYSSGSSANLTVLLALQKAGLKLTDVKSDQIQPTVALPAIENGQIDAWATWYPFIAEAEAAGAKVLELGTSLDPGYNFTLSNTDALANKAKSAAIADFIHRIGLAQIWADTHLAAWSKVYAGITGLTLAEATETEKISDKQVEVPVNQAVVSAEQKAANAFTSAGAIDESIVFKKVVDEKFNGDIPKVPTKL